MYYRFNFCSKSSRLTPLVSGIIFHVKKSCPTVIAAKTAKTVPGPITLNNQGTIAGIMAANTQCTDVPNVLTIRPGEHGSTFGGNPLACAVAMEALKVVLDENLAENAEKMGILFRNGLQKIAEKNKLITLVRGKGLLNAIVIDSHEDSHLAWNICIEFRNNGLLAKPTHGNKIRLAPPLVINEAQIQEALAIIEKSLNAFV